MTRSLFQPVQLDPSLFDLTRGTANEQILDAAISHGVAIEQFKASEVRRIAVILNNEVLPDITRRLQSELNKVGIGPIPRKVQRLQDRATAIRGYLTRTTRKISDDHVRKVLEQFALAESEWQALSLSNATRPLNLSFVQPSPAVLRNAVNGTPFRGRLLKEWWASVGNSAATKILDEFVIGISLGESNESIMRRFTSVRGVSSKMRRDSMTVVRTATNHVSNQAREEVFKKNDDLIKEIQFVATLDSRTSDICMSLDGKTYPVGTPHPTPPLHPQCRSTVVPITKSWKELGIPLKEAPSGTRASMNGQVPAKQTYGQWLRKQSKAVQDDALGPGRARLFRQNKLSVQDLVDSKHRPITLAELRKKAGLKPTSAANSVSVTPRRRSRS